MKKGRFGLKKILGILTVVLTLTMMLGMTTSAAIKQVDKVDNSSKYKYYKVQMRKPGIIAFTGFSQNSNGQVGSIKVDICNKKKKKLNGASIKVKDNTRLNKFFAVNKGTYYLRVKNSNMFRLYYDSGYVKDVSSSKQSRAKSLKKGTEYHGVLGIGESKRKVDYYKIVLRKPQIVRLAMRADSSVSSTTIEFAPSKSLNLGKSFKYKLKNKEISRQFVTGIYGKLPKGTYYIKVYRTNKKASNNGTYALKWLK